MINFLYFRKFINKNIYIFIISLKIFFFIQLIYLRYNLNPITNNKTYSHLCDTVSNLCEFIFALFFLVGSFSGEHIFSEYGEASTFNFFMFIGLFVTFIFFTFDCGIHPFRDDLKV